MVAGQDPQERLRDIWNDCFPRHVTDPTARAQGKQRWGDRRLEHLPLTLQVISNSLPETDLRYGRQGTRQQ